MGMFNIPIGAKGESQILVTSDVAISFLGIEEARVLGTPWLILHLEITARNLAKSYLLDGQDTVGTQVNVKHLAPRQWGCASALSGRSVIHRQPPYPIQSRRFRRNRKDRRRDP